ncbi:MAG: alpha/beta hydrolase [Geitlerinemataceae cyanobacterium]
MNFGTIVRFPFKSILIRGWRHSAAIALLWSIAALPAAAAERISVRYGVLGRSLSVESLARYAETGEADAELEAYLNYLPEETRDRLPELLSTQLPVGALEASQFLYSPQGEFVLRQLGQVLSTDAAGGNRDTAFKGLRGAIVQAAASESGLTPIALLEAFPTRTLYIRISEAIAAVEQVRDTLEASQIELERFEARAAAIAMPNADGPPNWKALQVRGDYSWRIEPLALRDLDRDSPYGHQISGDLYVPTSPPPDRDAAPTVVISHGLGSNSRTFYYLAEHLASRGFAVLVPEHAGSNAKHLAALIRGAENEIAKPSEFDDRPRDISLLLDEIERRAASEPARFGGVDPTQSIVFGHSFGGYTALALVGAEIDIEALDRECQRLGRGQQSLNLSLLLQCRLWVFLTEDGGRVQPWRDERVHGAVAVSPVGSAIFGETGLAQVEAPVAIVAGSADTVAPAYVEQIGIFDRLPVEDRQLILWQGGTHFSPIAIPPGDTTSVALPASVIGPDPQLAHRDIEAIVTAFAHTHLLDDPGARTLLAPSALNALGSEALPILAIDGTTPDVPTVSSPESAASR